MQNITVRQLNLYVKSLIEGSPRLNNVSVCGELSNFKNHYASGHFYFTLKDNDASIRCVMFRSFASALTFSPVDGMKVIITGRVSLYEKDGQYQLYAEQMIKAGIGDFVIEFEKIKQKLEKEGLFSLENKRPLPSFPKRIAVVTSETGAAVRDIINVTSRRYPVCNIVMCPVTVQGELAVPEIIETLDRLYSIDDIDLIIIGRGGGSIEDLWAFNSELLARKIYESPVPVISAVGHETDFTICDFVADLRAPTPSAAAELAVPDINDLLLRINNLKLRMMNSLDVKYKYNFSVLSNLISSRFFCRPDDFLISTHQQNLDTLSDRLKSSFVGIYKEKLNEFTNSVAKLNSLSPLNVLERGYSVLYKKGKLISSVDKVDVKDNITVQFKDGTLSCNVLKKEKTI